MFVILSDQSFFEDVASRAAIYGCLASSFLPQPAAVRQEQTDLRHRTALFLVFQTIPWPTYLQTPDRLLALNKSTAWGLFDADTTRAARVQDSADYEHVNA
jgi:hypothetical protein